MRIAITGVAGFIGSRIAKRFLDTTRVEVVGIDALTDYYSTALKKENLRPLMDYDNFRFIEGNIAALGLERVLDGVERIYHQAGQPGVRGSWGDSFSIYTDNNVIATQRLLETATRLPSLRSLIYASSSSIYGEADTYPTDESVLPRPRSPYGVSKLAAEHLCGLYAANFGVPTVSLRYFTVFGPGQRPDMAFTRFITRGLLGQTIEVFGNGAQVRDFTYIDDVVDANVLAGRADLPPGTVLNICGGSRTSLQASLDVLGELLGELSIRYSDPVAGDVRRTGGDNAVARKMLDWEPAFSVADGLTAQVEWAERNLTLLRESAV